MTLTITQEPALHFEDRKNGGHPAFLILHYTGTPTAQIAKDMLTGRMQNTEGNKVSVHYMIEEDGHLTQLVNEDKRAYHAGLGYWEGITDINSFSIGIELQNPGWEHGYTDFPQAQIDALIELCRDIVSRHNMRPDHVLGHSDVSAGRRFDPGEKFPWKALADAGIGLWPQPIQADFNEAAALLQDTSRLKQALVSYGYNPALDLPLLVREFQRHFQPDAFTGPQPYAGTANDQTTLRLASLLRQKLAIIP